MSMPKKRTKQKCPGSVTIIALLLIAFCCFAFLCMEYISIAILLPVLLSYLFSRGNKIAYYIMVLIWLLGTMISSWLFIYVIMYSGVYNSITLLIGVLLSFVVLWSLFCSEEVRTYFGIGQKKTK